jgi:hypothetical protein
VGLLGWRARLVGQCGSPARFISLAPFIPSFSTDTVSAALLGEELIAFFDSFHEGNRCSMAQVSFQLINFFDS